MDNLEIKKEIDLLREEIREKANLTTGQLSTETTLLSQKITFLQNQCNHEYENKICKYCYLEEK